MLSTCHKGENLPSSGSFRPRSGIGGFLFKQERASNIPSFKRLQQPEPRTSPSASASLRDFWTLSPDPRSDVSTNYCIRSTILLRTSHSPILPARWHTMVSLNTHI